MKRRVKPSRTRTLFIILYRGDEVQTIRNEIHDPCTLRLAWHGNISEKLKDQGQFSRYIEEAIIDVQVCLFC